jgi:hypothetical protein
MEEVLETGGISVTIRPSKPVDERRIQEHYYNLEKEDVLSCFFNEKTIFGLPETEQRSKIDYIKDMTILTLVGEFGFGQVIAVGESMYLPELNMSEVTFSFVNQLYQFQCARNQGFSRIKPSLILKNSDTYRRVEFPFTMTAGDSRGSHRAYA